jgi:hypothetical protein
VLAADPAARTPRRRTVRIRYLAAAALTVAAGVGAWVALPWQDRPEDPYAHSLRTESDVPPQFRKAIVDAAWCTKQVPEVTPALLAASLKTLSNFNPSLSDPGKDEYGIARWTPRVLAFYLPPEQKSQAKRLTFNPYVSIHHMGRYLCRLAEEPLQRQLLAAAIFQSNTEDMRATAGIPDYARWYTERIKQHLPSYTPRSD